MVKDAGSTPAPRFEHLKLNKPYPKKHKKIPFTPLTRAGTGKTYASAFAMRELGFKRVLFLVHRNQIAKQAKTSFERVFGSRIKTGLVSGIKAMKK